MSEGEVGRWLCEEGSEVQAGQPLLEVMSKKITYKVAAPAPGVVRQLAEVKAKAPVGAVLGYVLAPEESLPEGAARISAEKTAPKAMGAAGDAPSSAFNQKAAAADVMATPAAKRLARDRGIDLSRVSGSGPGGRIQEQDVYAYLTAGQTVNVRPPAEPFEEAGPTPLPFDGMRAAIAERMVQSLRQTAQVTLMTEVDAGEMVALTRLSPVRVSLTGVTGVLTTKALKAHPRLNATLIGERIHLFSEVHLGVAVALDDGLIVPVVRNAERLDLAAFDRELARLSEAARNHALTVDDVTGSTFTVTNLGMFGIDGFTPIINQPECAILGVGRVIEKPVVRAGAIVVRPQITLSLTFDHRLVDGAPAAQFLQTLSDYMAHPGLAFIGGDGERR